LPERSDLIASQPNPEEKANISAIHQSPPYPPYAIFRALGYSKGSSGTSALFNPHESSPVHGPGRKSDPASIGRVHSALYHDFRPAGYDPGGASSSVSLPGYGSSPSPPSGPNWHSHSQLPPGTYAYTYVPRNTSTGTHFTTGGHVSGGSIQARPSSIYHFIPPAGYYDHRVMPPSAMASGGSANSEPVSGHYHQPGVWYSSENVTPPFSALSGNSADVGPVSGFHPQPPAGYAPEHITSPFPVLSRTNPEPPLAYYPPPPAGYYPQDVTPPFSTMSGSPANLGSVSAYYPQPPPGYPSEHITPPFPVLALNGSPKNPGSASAYMYYPTPPTGHVSSDITPPISVQPAPRIELGEPTSQSESKAQGQSQKPVVPAAPVMGGTRITPSTAPWHSSFLTSSSSARDSTKKMKMKQLLGVFRKKT